MFSVNKWGFVFVNRYDHLKSYPQVVKKLML